MVAVYYYDRFIAGGIAQSLDIGCEFLRSLFSKIDAEKVLVGKQTEGHETVFQIIPVKVFSVIIVKFRKSVRFKKGFYRIDSLIPDERFITEDQEYGRPSSSVQ